MKQLTILLLAFLLVPGHALAQKSLGRHKDVRKVFTRTEIQDLEKIIAFFNDAICTFEGLKRGDVNACYHQLFETLRSAENAGHLEVPISIDEQDAFLASLDPATFGLIWRYDKSWQDSDTFHVINISHDGKYMKFLREYGWEHHNVRDYSDKLRGVGSISPSMIADILENSKQYDIRDQRMKLLIAVHYLTLNDQLSKVYSRR